MVDNRVEFVEWANSVNVEAVFSGHTHSDRIFYDVQTDPGKPGYIDAPYEKEHPTHLHTLAFENPTYYTECGEST